MSGNTKRRKKDLSIYFLHLIKEKGTADTENYKWASITKDELLKIINDIKSLPFDSSEPANRYSDEEDPKCIIFSDDDIIKNNPHFFIPKIENFVTGAFFKKRNTDFPYQADDDNTIQRLNLPDGSVIIETTYFIIEPRHRILIWLGNKTTSGYKGFVEYLTRKYYSVCKHENREKPTQKNKNKMMTDYSPLIVETKPARIGANLIINPDNYQEFKDSMFNISEFELKIAGSMVEMDKLYGANSDIESALKRAISIGNDLGCGSIYVKVQSEKEKSLEKGKILKVVESLKSIKEKQKIIVRGEIDDEKRYIDLIEDHFTYKTTINIEDRYIDQRKIFDAMKKGYDIYIKRMLEIIE